MNAPNAFYTPISQTLSGNGSAGAPFTVVTVEQLNSSITLTQTVSYVAGRTYFTETNTLTNNGPPVSAKIFNAAEPDPGSADSAFGYYDPVSGAVGASNPVNAGVVPPGVYPCTAIGAVPSIYRYSVYFAPITHWQRSVVDQYLAVFNQVSASRTGASLSNTYNTTCTDPAMAVEWDVSVGTGSSVSVSKSVVFTSTLPPFSPGTIRGHVSCSGISAPYVTCSPIPAGNACPACGSSLNFFIPVSCGGAPLDLQNIPCMGAVTGHLGLPNFTMSVKAGGISPGPHLGATVTLYGQGTYFSAGASFFLVAADNDVTGVDTIQLKITGFKGVTNYTWTCYGVPSCLEIL